MPQSLAQVYLHLIFSTKDRRPFLSDPGLRQEMHAYMSAIMKDRDCPALLISGTADHIHILCRPSKTEAIGKLIGETKRLTSIWIKRREPKLADFNWQSGYGAFSVSASNIQSVQKYVARQEEHHLKVSFQEELKAFLDRHGVQFDERYLWD